ncbi:MAG TPA: hypothetical protein VHM70_14560 [Polyangiaceae bacterium]|nr:hypothetical protein [Polyangiaceae bacterium]
MAPFRNRLNSSGARLSLSARRGRNARGRWTLHPLGLLLSLAVLPACSAKDNDLDTARVPTKTKTSKSNKPKGTDATPAAAKWIGDGSKDGVDYVEIYVAPKDFFCSLSGCRVGIPADLDFNPFRPGEMWVVFRQPYVGQTCNADDPQSIGCELMGSKVAIITGADGDAPSTEIKEDGNSWHFMRRVTSLAFADDDSFATVGEARTGNFFDDAPSYMGPTWWSADPTIFAVDFGRNGSHLDMLHATPFGMGIAHDPRPMVGPHGKLETQPVFWAFNGAAGAIDRYDFNLPHEPGGKDHSDGELARYATGSLKMIPDVPSHMEFADRSTLEEKASDPDWWLYVADTGNHRVVRLDPDSGVVSSEPLVTDEDQVKNPQQVDGAVVEEVVAEGVLGLPSGIAVAGSLLFVSDGASSSIHVFDLDGKALGQLDTGLPSGSLAGIAVGPDQRLYFVDWLGSRVVRIEPHT